jgi:aminoglycoside 2'-N-acetyltransferase I
MMDALERLVRGAYDLGALSTSDAGADFYAARGWRRWQGPSSALTPTGIRRTEDDDGGIYVPALAARLDVSGALTSDWRDGDLW